MVTIPLFAIGVALTQIDFGIIWRYFGWANQTLATVVLWAAAVYMLKQGKTFWFVLIPAVFMTAVSVSYIFVAPEGFQMEKNISYLFGIGSAVILMLAFLYSPTKVKVMEVYAKIKKE
jgi:carbon starvation protein CstA